MYRELTFSYSVINNFPRHKKKLTFFLIPQLRFLRLFPSIILPVYNAILHHYSKENVKKGTRRNKYIKNEDIS